MTELASLRAPLVLSLNVADIAEDDWSSLLNYLPSDEQKRAHAFHHVADHRSFVAAHALLRLTLACFVGSSPAEIRFTANAYGKPCFATDHAHADIDFSISHSRGMVVAGVARGAAIGVDTELKDRLTERDILAAAHWLSPDELSHVAAWDDAERVGRLLDLWTLKEAVVKATGHGLSLDLSSFSVDPERLSVGGLGGAWHLQRWMHNSHRVAVALLGELSSAPRHHSVSLTNNSSGPEIVLK